MSLIIPAVLPSSREDLDEKLSLFARLPSVSRVQIDVVDGRFASPASWPYTAPEELRNMVAQGEMLPALDRISYEVDFMCSEAERAAEEWVALGASRLTFHAESIRDIAQFLESVRAHFGCGPIACDLITIGLALNIESDISLIEPYLDRIDYVQFMGIARIGRQGQLFDRRVLEKVRVFHARYPQIAMQVDGGISFGTAKQLVSFGVTNLVVGSAILRAADPNAELEKFESLRAPAE